MNNIKRINKILLVLIVITLLLLTGCKKNKVDITESIVCLNGELYSSENQNGLIMSAIVSFYDLEAKRENITGYGFAYTFSCPSTVDPIVLGNEGVYEVTVDDVDKSNNINCIINIPEEYYNTDMAFRPFIKYHEKDSDVEKVLYSFDYNAANLYELAKNVECDFATTVINKVENK